eukprot:GEMP01014348.1.p1 GENE.GEMP01014348.1~~GEMP01014348.1.p1  ORF type:complete len:964 (+),score=172.76 GEMP01014348.1:44-2935(+)
MISVVVDFAEESIQADVSVVARTPTLKLELPSGKGRLCSVNGAQRWGQGGMIQCEVGAKLDWCWKDTTLSLDVHPQDTNRPPGLVPDMSRRFQCGFFAPGWCPMDKDYASDIKEVRVKTLGGEVLLASNRRLPASHNGALNPMPNTGNLDPSGYTMKLPLVMKIKLKFRRTLSHAKMDVRVEDGWTVFPGDADFLIIVGDFTVDYEGPWRISYPRTLGPTRAPSITRLLQNLEKEVGYANPANQEAPDIVFLPLPFLQPDPVDDCCWGQGANWFRVGSMLVFDLQFLGQSDPLLEEAYRNRRHALCRAVASYYVRPEDPDAVDPWIEEALPVVLADLAESAWLDYGTLQLRLAERSQICMEVDDDPLEGCTDLVHCARKGSLVLHEARRLGCPMTTLLKNPTGAHLTDMLTVCGVNPLHFSNMWITGFSFPVVSISYAHSTRSSKLEMILERTTKNQLCTASHWEGGITFEVWGYAKKKDSKKQDDSCDEKRIECLDTKTLNFVVDGPSKLEGTLAISGEFTYVKVTDVWIAAEVNIDQSTKAWVSSLRTRCDTRIQWWIVTALCRQQHFKILEQVIESKDMHPIIRQLTVSELFTANHSEPLLKLCEHIPLDEESKPAYYSALAHIGQMETPVATKLIAGKIKDADPWAIAAMVGQRPSHQQAQHLCRTLVEQDPSDPHGVIMSKCLQTLEDSNLAKKCLYLANTRASMRLSWNLWKQFCPESQKWQLDGDPPVDAPLIEPGYRYPRTVRKRAILLLQAEEDKLPAAPTTRRTLAAILSQQPSVLLQKSPAELQTNEELQRWLWMLESRAQRGYEVDAEVLAAHPLLRPALLRLQAPSCGRLGDETGGPLHWSVEASKVIHQMCQYSDSYHFRNTLSEFPEKFLELYKCKVPCPMDLNTVQKKLRLRKYHSEKEFVVDVELVWKNAETFNGPAHHITHRAIRCRSHFHTIYKPERGRLTLLG